MHQNRMIHLICLLQCSEILVTVQKMCECGCISRNSASLGGHEWVNGGGKLDNIRRAARSSHLWAAATSSCPGRHDGGKCARLRAGDGIIDINPAQQRCFIASSFFRREEIWFRYGTRGRQRRRWRWRRRQHRGGSISRM